ncbi:hypothetical protein HK405_004788 [Cladochytrium tenue]|nr:hypothetical protein HK405_004788 [Cladochytrium tenue]
MSDAVASGLYTPPAMFLQQYMLGEPIGSGGFGFVRSARHRASGREVAAKFIARRRVPAGSWVEDDQVLGGSRLPVEVHVLRRVRHAGVISFVDCFEDDEYVVLLTELHGEKWGPVRPGRSGSSDLFECVEAHGRLSETQARLVFAQVAGAVAHLDALGIVHGDIKDENVLVDSSLTVRLIDFGSARVASRGSGNARPSGSVFLGTKQYAAPEILHGVVSHGPSCEVWSLACVLYIMVSGELPFIRPASPASGAFERIVAPACVDVLEEPGRATDRVAAVDAALASTFI